MKQQWLLWQQKFDALNQRERVIVFVIALLVVYLILQSLVLDPLLRDRTVTLRQQQQLQQQIAELQEAKTVLNTQLDSGVNRAKEQRREQLRMQVNTLDEQIERSVLAMIPPQKMAQVLESVLLQDKNLKLLAIENRPGLPVLKTEDLEGNKSETNKSSRKKTNAPTTSANASAAPALYQHSFVITLEGDYLSTIAYFNRLSELPWRFYWDSLIFSVDRYPKATITLTVHTVSLSEEWIGV